MSVGKLVRNGLPFSNVVASGVATNNVTPGRTLEVLQLVLGGTSFAKSMISMFKLKANGRTLIEATGTELDKLNAYRGETTNAAYLNIPFFDEFMFEPQDRAASSFDTSQGVQNITTEVTINGATAPTIKPIVIESASQAAQPNKAAFAGLVGKILRYPFSMANGGTLPITVPFGPTTGAIIKRLHVLHGGNMTGATVKQDGMVIHESLTADNVALLTRSRRVPQANMYTIDFCADGNLSNALDTRDAKSLEWLLAFSAADSGTILVEYLDALGNL
jgi:Viral coat protein P2 N-terminal domain